MNFLLRFFPKVNQHPLSYRLLAYVVLCSSLFALLATATQLYLDYRRDVSAIYESFNFIKKSYLHAIAVSTFKIDMDHLELELEGALKLPDIVFLEVHEFRGNQVYTYSKGNPNAAKIIQKEFPLEYVSPTGQKRLMGTLLATASFEGVYQRLWSRAITILATNIIKTFLASACILAIIYFLFTRHLTRMANFTQQLVPGKQNQLLALNRRSHGMDKPDELEQVVAAINDLQERSIKDVNRRQQAELEAQRHRAELTHVSRIATMGELSASLAHELNQPLTAILSNAETARRFLTGDMADQNEIDEILKDIIHDNKRAANMIKRLRTLMQKKELEYTSLDLNKVVQGVAELAAREMFAKDVTLTLDLAADVPHVRGDAIHLEQVALNLILNGIESMEAIDPQFRELRITSATHLDHSVRVSVQDRGTGVDETRVDQIFDAFYTTKPEGMGMGLSICRSIIEAHGGRLWVENIPEGGARFSFTVPVVVG